MRAFTDTTMTKPELVAEMKWHQEQDNFMKGTYSDLGGKGCAVGCAIMSLNKKKNLNIYVGSHDSYEPHFGVPAWLARLEDEIFEGVSIERSKIWPVEFIEAINEGSDLEKIKKPFIALVLKSTLKNFDHKKYPEVKAAIEGSIKFWETEYESEAAESAAESAAEPAARSAAESAAEPAARSAAESAAWSAAWSAAESAAEPAARSAAESAAWSAARSAAWSAARSAAEPAAESAAESAAFEYYADELLKLIRECK